MIKKKNKMSKVLYTSAVASLMYTMVLHLCKNSTYHSKSRHIDVSYHWIHDVLESKLLQIEKIHTNENGVDMMTKTLPKEKLEFCKEVAGWRLPQIDQGHSPLTGGEEMWEFPTFQPMRKIWFLTFPHSVFKFNNVLETF
jgi:hypothetical protein